MIPSCSTITWGELKREEEFRDALSSIRKLGYTDAGVEFAWLPPALRKDPARGGKLVKVAGLTVSAVAIDSSPEMANVVPAFDSKVGWLCLFEKDPAGTAAVTKLHLREFGKRGLKVGVHPHIRSNVETNRQLDELIAACKPASLDVCFDSAHQQALKMDLPGFIERYKDRLCLVHLKDLRVMKDIKDIDFDDDFVDFGEGVCDFPAIMKALKKARYGGWLMVEVDFAHKITVEESVKKNFDYLKPLM